MATDFKRHLIYQLFLIFTATSYFPGEHLSLFALSISSICSGVKWSTKLKRKTELNRSLLRKFFKFFHPAICLLLPFVKMTIYELFSDAIFNVHANSRISSEPTINEISPDWKIFSLFKFDNLKNDDICIVSPQESSVSSKTGLPFTEHLNCISFQGKSSIIWMSLELEYSPTTTC